MPPALATCTVDTQSRATVHTAQLTDVKDTKDSTIVPGDTAPAPHNEGLPSPLYLGCKHISELITELIGLPDIVTSKPFSKGSDASSCPAALSGGVPPADVSSNTPHVRNDLNYLDDWLSLLKLQQSLVMIESISV